MSSYRALARNHDFTGLWIGQTISELGSRMSMFVFPLLAYQLTGSAFVAAAAETAHLLGFALALLPAGVLADRLDRIRLMRLASGSGVLLYGSLVGAALLGSLSIPHLLFVALLTGVGAGVFAPAEISAVRAVVPDEDLPTALSQNQARQHVASLLGGPVGGALYGVTRWLPFAADALSFAVSFVLLGRIRADLSAPSVDGPRKPPRQELLEGLRFIRTRPFFRVLTVWAALINLVVNALFFVAVLRLIQAGFHPVHIGLVETAAGACGILGALAAPWIIDRFATGWLTVMVAWSFVPLVLPMVFWNNPAVVAAALGARPVPQPGRQCRHRRLPHRDDSRRAPGPGPVVDAVRLDVHHAAGAHAGGRAAGRSGRRRRDRGSWWAHGRGRADPDPEHQHPVRAAARRLAAPQRLPGVRCRSLRDGQQPVEHGERLGPDVGVGVDHRVVIGRHLHEVGRAAGSPGRRDVAPATARSGRWCRRAPCTHQTGTSSGTCRIGSASCVVGTGRMAQKRFDRAAAEPLVVRAAQVEDPRLGDDSGERDAFRLPALEPTARGGPGCEVAAGGVAEGDDLGRVEIVDVGERVDPGGDVVQGRRDPPPLPTRRYSRFQAVQPRRRDWRRAVGPATGRTPPSRTRHG